MSRHPCLLGQTWGFTTLARDLKTFADDLTHLFLKMISQVSVSIPDRRDPQAPVNPDGQATFVSADFVFGDHAKPRLVEPEQTFARIVSDEHDTEQECEVPSEEPQVLPPSIPASDSNSNDTGKEALE